MRPQRRSSNKLIFRVFILVVWSILVVLQFNLFCTKLFAVYLKLASLWKGAIFKNLCAIKFKVQLNEFASKWSGATQTSNILHESSKSGLFCNSPCFSKNHSDNSHNCWKISCLWIGILETRPPNIFQLPKQLNEKLSGVQMNCPYNFA